VGSYVRHVALTQLPPAKENDMLLKGFLTWLSTHAGKWALWTQTLKH